MRISRRTSGGRGEYEISESLDGIGPRDVLERVVYLDLGAVGILNTAVRLLMRNGKPRLRLISSAGIQLPRQAAIALLLPSPVRADDAMGAGEPVFQQNRYAIETIELSRAIIPAPLICVLTPAALIGRNKSHAAEEIDVTSRAAEVEILWSRAGEFPDDIRDFLRQHHARCANGGPLAADDEDLVVNLQRLLSDSSSDLGVIYSEGFDPVPSLLQALKVDTPEPLLRIEDVDPLNLELKRRTVKEWKRWANARGAVGARFRHDVRAGYHSRCVICGAHFPSTLSTAAGVDAAHILPWSEYNLDSIRNGLCLCKLHHWAYDEGLLRVRAQPSGYISYIDEALALRVIAAAPQFSLDLLKQHVGPVPLSRLPADPQHWPNPEFLGALENLSC